MPLNSPCFFFLRSLCHFLLSLTSLCFSFPPNSFCGRATSCAPASSPITLGFCLASCLVSCLYGFGAWTVGICDTAGRRIRPAFPRRMVADRSQAYRRCISPTRSAGGRRDKLRERRKLPVWNKQGRYRETGLNGEIVQHVPFSSLVHSVNFALGWLNISPRLDCRFSYIN